MLVTYKLISYVNGLHPSATATNASMARIREYTHDAAPPRIVFELEFFDHNNLQPTYLGSLCYRSYQIPDLYAHPCMPVADLSVTMSTAGPRLQFSGDPTRPYTVEAANDQMQWQQLGTPTVGSQPETFVFVDSGSASAVRFYRVVTQLNGLIQSNATRRAKTPAARLH